MGQGALPSQAQAFVACRDIIKDQYTSTFLLVGPFQEIALDTFPAQFCLSLYVQLLGGTGTDALDVQLRGGDGQVVWQGPWPESPGAAEPGMAVPSALDDVTVPFPRPGRYDLVLRAKGQDLAHYALRVKRQSKAQLGPGESGPR